MLTAIPSPGSNGIHLGPLELRAYGLCYVVAIAAAISITARRWTAQGGSRELVTQVAVWGVPAGLVGGRLYYLATSWDEVPHHWWGPLAVWKGGLGIWGGIAFGTLVGIWRLRRAGADVPRFLDAAAPGLLVAQSIGRVGNWFNQELFGRPTWASGGPEDDRSWYSTAAVDVPNDLLEADEVDGEPGPWLLIEAFLEHRDRERGRRVFGFFRGVLADRADTPALTEVLSQRPYLGNHFVPDAPSDLSTFAGEIPWSAGFADHGDMENGLEAYRALVRERWDEPGIEIEVLGHRYEIEASRTETNVASGQWVPSQRLAAAFDLRRRPGTLDLVGLDGRTASITRIAPVGFDGTLLYVRRDLVAEYAGARDLIQLAWGERQIDFDWNRRPEWLDDLRSENAELWRRVHVSSLG